MSWSDQRSAQVGPIELVYTCSPVGGENSPYYIATSPLYCIQFGFTKLCQFVYLNISKDLTKRFEWSCIKVVLVWSSFIYFLVPERRGRTVKAPIHATRERPRVWSLVIRVRGGVLNQLGNPSFSVWRGVDDGILILCHSNRSVVLYV